MRSTFVKKNGLRAIHSSHVGPMANTFYASGTPTEISPFYFFKQRIKEKKY
jgi:hypothetical protein